MVSLLLCLFINYNIQISDEFVKDLENKVIKQQDICRGFYIQDTVSPLILKQARILCNKNIILIIKLNNVYDMMKCNEFKQDIDSLTRTYINTTYHILNNINTIQTILLMKNVTRF